MRKFKTGLITLAASAAILVPAGLANASTQSAATPSTASDVCVGLVTLCVDVLNDNNVVIKTGDILSNDVTSVCILSGNLNNNLDILNRGGTIACSGNSNKMKKH
jgi:hypothetical protein